MQIVEACYDLLLVLVLAEGAVDDELVVAGLGRVLLCFVSRGMRARNKSLTIWPVLVLVFVRVDEFGVVGRFRVRM